MMSSSNEEKPETLSTNTEDDDSALMELDLAERKVKAKELRQEATDLEEASAALRKDAVKKEQLAAKLRIRAWKLEGSVSAVTNEINIGNKYERQLAELDIMAEDWIDTDEEKWDWYQKQREMIMEMIESQKYYDKQADEQIQDLKEVLSEVSTLLGVQTLDTKGDITGVGWGFVFFSVVIPLLIGYELFNFLSSSSAAFFGALTGKDPFDSL